MVPRSAPRSRCLAVVAGASVPLALLLAVTGPVLLQGTAPASFDDLLVRGCALVATGSGAWLWAVTGAVAVGAARGRGEARRTWAVPVPLQRAVLAACGVALVAGSAPAAAHPSGSSSGPAATSSTAAWVARALDRPAPDTVVVRAGDSLWAIAEERLAETAPVALVARHWQHVHDLNRAVIGDDPDLIHPGQRLRLPPAPHEGAPR